MLWLIAIVNWSVRPGNVNSFAITKKMKVLFVATTFPVPPHAGAKVALLETLRSIEELCELHVLLPRTEDNSEDDVAVLRQNIPQTRIHFYGNQSRTPPLICLVIALSVLINEIQRERGSRNKITSVL